MYLFHHEASTRRTPEGTFALLHGMWRDEVRGSTMCIDARTTAPVTVYCSGGDNELTGQCLFWQHRRGQFYARFRWLHQPISGIFVLQVQSEDSLIGGWWYDQDLEYEDYEKLPFVAGVHPCRWVRQDPRRPWPLWAAEKLGLPTDGSLTSESLAAMPAAGRPAHSAAGRYNQRVALWTAGHAGLRRLAAGLRHRGWWLLHNLVAHPLLALTHGPRAVALHDWASRGLNRDETIEPSPPPRIERRLWWVVHNLLAHPAIALAPCAATFRWHDATAERMRVAGWV